MNAIARATGVNPSTCFNILRTLAGEGLHPSSRGRRIQFRDGERRIVDGPFAETKELIAGFWLWQVTSMDEAME